MISRAIYRALATVRAPQTARRLRPAAPVYCFHNVVSPEDAGVGDASLHMPVDRFAAIVAWMQSAYEVVHVDEIAERAGAGRSVAGLAAITFDDAYQGTFDHGLPVLAAAGLPSTVYVVSSFPRARAFTWWDVLAGRGLLDAARRDHELSAHRGLAEEILADDGAVPDGAAPPRPHDLPDAFLPATWETITRNVNERVGLGSHTVRHANLTALAPDELEAEVTRSRHEIREHTGRDPTTISYPYGLWNPNVLRAARAAGYAAGLTLGNRPARGGEDLLGIPRINVPAGISPEALACWSAGIRLRRPW